MDPYFSHLILGPQLSGFLKAYPELKVDLITRAGLGDLISTPENDSNEILTP